MGRDGQILREGPERYIVVFENLFDIEEIDHLFLDLIGPFGIDGEISLNPGIGFSRSLGKQKSRRSSCRRQNR